MLTQNSENEIEHMNSSLRILVVEDNADVAAMLQQILTGDGHLVTVAGSCKEFVAAYQKYDGTNTFDIIITDFDLGDGNGLDVARAVRVESDLLPIVMVSSHSCDERIMKAAYRAGICALVNKPFQIAELTAAIKKAMDSVLDIPAPMLGRVLQPA